ncbi:MAG: tetratricopeptide repeat protein [Spirochaetota bacterium]
MAFEIKGFRGRRRAAKQAGEAETTPAVNESEKIPLGVKLQHWVNENPRVIRNSIFVIVGITVSVVLVLVLRAAAKDEHSRKLHVALEKYEQIKILPKGDARAQQMKEFGQGLKPVCEQTIATLESAAACFTAGTALLEGRDPAAAAALFARAASGYDTDAMASVAGFMQAQALESARDFEKALAVYKDLEKKYVSIKKGEMALFHQGRMLYYLGRYDEAEEKFAKLSRDSEGKEFAASSRNYISLLNAERSQLKK